MEKLKLDIIRLRRGAVATKCPKGGLMFSLDILIRDRYLVYTIPLVFVIILSTLFI